MSVERLTAALADRYRIERLLYYVMPLVTGETLRARLEREQQLPIPDAVRIAREVADALGYAHGLGVVHRDIKPENILLQGARAGRRACGAGVEGDGEGDGADAQSARVRAYT